MADGRLKYYFVAGVEGCGHHGLHPVIATALRESTPIKARGGALIAKNRKLKRAFNTLWCRRHPLGLTRALARNYAESFFRREYETAMRTGQTRIILEDNSFPAGKYRDFNRQWDLHEMYDIVRQYAEVKFIALYRHPIATTYSHKNWDGGIHQHAQTIKTALEYLNRQLAGLPEGLLQVVHYEDLSEAQEKLAKQLADYLEVTEENVQAGFSKVRPSKKDWRQELAQEDQDKLLAVFSDEQAAAHWPVFARAPRLAG